MKRIFILALMLILIAPAVVLAQGSTTGAFNGTVTDADGSALAGVDVTLVHNPTGTKYRTISRSNGLYNIPSVKVGGPYTLTVEFEGMRTEKYDNLVVKLGENKRLNVKLYLATVDAGEVLVTASSPIINPARTGASHNVVQESIEALPSISRSLSDFTRLAPQFASGEDSGAFSAAGRSPRYNNIQIDGAQNNDLFGLGNSGTPGGQTATTPISLDAIQEFQIVLAPYDVRQGSFTGGGVNVITKSGTNEFHGSFSFYGRNEKMVGDGPSEYEFAEFQESTYSMTFGGPIVKNKVFFFVNGEITRQKAPENYFIDGSGTDYDYGHKEDADRFVSLLNGYGYDPGTYGEIANEIKSDKIFFRLDFNLSDNHRLTLRDNYVKASRDILRRASDSSFTFGNGGYLMESKTNSLVLQLNSTLGQSLYNELTLNYTTIRDNRGGTGADFPRVYIDDIKFYAGTEVYSTRNQLDQDIIEFTDNLTIYKGNHTFTLGTHNEFFKFYNVFVKKNFGYYTFDDLDAFEAGEAYKYELLYSRTSDPNAPAEFSVAQVGFYAGDQWAISPKANLTFGVRADLPVFPDTPLANPAVFETFGIRTDQVPSGNLLISPRLGFNFDMGGEQKTQVRGGIGIFSGRTPFVWISNQFGNTGMTLSEYSNYGDFVF
ncbi:MAG: TonB-dependent receptor, partial [bacterium]|nr:TonB-dependent receptor [bacterium]